MMRMKAGLFSSFILVFDFHSGAVIPESFQT